MAAALGSAAVVASADEQRVEALGRRGRALAAQIAALQAELVDVATEVGRLDGHLSGATPRAWAAWQWGLTPAEASRCFQLAERLPDLPGLGGELAAGRLSEGSVVALSSVATPENEASLVETAHHATGAQLVSLVRSLRRVRRQDQPAPRPEERCTHGIEADGLWHLHAALSPERGDLVAKALRREREQLVDAVRADRKAGVPEGDAPWPTAVDALVALGRSGLSAAVRADGTLPERFRTTVVIDADAVAEDLATFDGTTLPPDDEAWRRAARRRLAGDRAGDGAAGGLAAEPRCEIVGLGGIEPSLAAELTCRAALSVLVLERGRPVTLTSPTRAPNAAQWQALEVRDRTCRFPGCGATRDLQPHHIEGWALDGPTRLANLVLLCPKHHRTVHRRHLCVDLDDATGSVRFRRADGTLLDPAPPRPDPPPRPPDPPPGIDRSLVVRDRLTEFAADVTLATWSNPPGQAPAA